MIRELNSPVKDLKSQMVPLLSELQNLKRIQPAHLNRSIASELFVESWRLIYQGHDLDAVSIIISTKAILAMLLPGCDRHFFNGLKIESSMVNEILESAFGDAVRERLPKSLRSQLQGSVRDIALSFASKIDKRENAGNFEIECWFVPVLCKQPRAGATAPGQNRLLLYPPEMHSDHCLIVAVYAVLLSPCYSSGTGLPFFTGLVHHLHNCILPDCGFAGEVAFDGSLAQIISNSVDKALEQTDKTFELKVRNALANHENISNRRGKQVQRPTYWTGCSI